jgi:hypothetical protein
MMLCAFIFFILAIFTFLNDQYDACQCFALFMIAFILMERKE